MFWKKKTDPGAKNSIEIEFEPDRREYYRVDFDQDNPVLLRVGKHELHVKDLSAGGLALAAKGLPVGRSLSGELILPLHDEPIEVSLSIVHSSPDRPSSCEITQISEHDREILHQYVLSLQKSKLERERKEQEKKNRDLLSKRQ